MRCVLPGTRADTERQNAVQLRCTHVYAGVASQIIAHLHLCVRRNDCGLLCHVCSTGRRQGLLKKPKLQKGTGEVCSACAAVYYRCVKGKQLLQTLISEYGECVFTSRRVMMDERAQCVSGPPPLLLARPSGARLWRGAVLCLWFCNSARTDRYEHENKMTLVFTAFVV